MHHLFRHRPSLAVVVSPIAVVVALGGVAWASIPDATGVIHGCYNKSGGALRVIDTAISTQKCTSTQVPLSWSQKGPPGPPGPAGATNVNEYAGIGADSVVLGPQNFQDSIQVLCPTGQVATGGGFAAVHTGVGSVDYSVSSPGSEAVLSSSGVPIGWQVAAVNTAPQGDATVSARVICASP